MKTEGWQSLIFTISPSAIKLTYSKKKKYPLNMRDSFGKKNEGVLIFFQVPPPVRWLKANIDGAFDIITRLGGIGMVLRDSTGAIVSGIFSIIGNLDSSELVEFQLVGRVARLQVAQYNLAPQVFQSDCLSLVQATKSDKENTSPFWQSV